MTTKARLIDDQQIKDYGQLVETQRRLHRVFDRSLRAKVGISIVWYEALLRLAHSPDRQMPITDLGEALVLTSSGATRLVDRLEESSYIARVPCPTDRRVLWARLTAQGRKVLATATKVHLDDLDRHFSAHLSGPELKKLRELLSRLDGR
ncbi:MAG: MarR family transcriptional regulator [Actinobacteria bacterium]|nr:MarR family transcriptional regulator [Actinomycetota bacterium]